MKRMKRNKTLWILEVKGPNGWLPSLSAMPFTRKSSAEFTAEAYALDSGLKYRVTPYIERPARCSRPGRKGEAIR